MLLIRLINVVIHAIVGREFAHRLGEFPSPPAWRIIETKILSGIACMFATPSKCVEAGEFIRIRGSVYRVVAVNLMAPSEINSLRTYLQAGFMTYNEFVESLDAEYGGFSGLNIHRIPVYLNFVSHVNMRDCYYSLCNPIDSFSEIYPEKQEMSAEKIKDIRTAMQNVIDALTGKTHEHNGE